MRFKVSTRLILILTLATLVLLHAVFFLFDIFHCVKYPFSLDWIEGGMLQQVQWVVSGRPLYKPPSIEFTPFIYMPLYTYIASVAAIIIRPTLPLLRAVSLVCVFGVFVMIYRFVFKETGKHYLSMASCALYAAGFIAAGGDLNLARVDHLYLFLLLLSVYLIRFKKSAASSLWAGLLISLAFMTKQTALIVFIPLSFYVLSVERKRSYVFLASSIIFSLSCMFLLNWLYGGWFFYYVFKVPSEHPLQKEMMFLFWKRDIFHYFAAAFIVSLIFIVSARLRRDSRTFVFYLTFFAGMLASSWLSRLYSGGFLNVLLPAYAALAVLFGPGLDVILNYCRPERKIIEAAALVLCIVQFTILLYNPLKNIPTQTDLDAGRQLAELIQGINGDVFLPFNSYLASMANKNSFSHYAALDDILRGKNDVLKGKLLGEINGEVRSKKFTAILLYPGQMDRGIETEILKNYKIDQALFYNGARYWPNCPDSSEFLCIKK